MGPLKASFKHRPFLKKSPPPTFAGNAIRIGMFEPKKAKLWPGY